MKTNTKPVILGHYKFPLAINERLLRERTFTPSRGEHLSVRIFSQTRGRAIHVFSELLTSSLTVEAASVLHKIL